MQHLLALLEEGEVILTEAKQLQQHTHVSRTRVPAQWGPLADAADEYTQYTTKFVGAATVFHIGRNTDCADALEHLLVPSEIGNHLICSTHMHDNAGDKYSHA